MVFVVFVVFARRMFVKPALQATLRVFGLCGSRVVLVWVGLWFLVTCGFLLWSARPIVLMWFLWVGGLVLDARCRRLRVHLAKVFVDLWSCLDVDDCASSCSLWTDKKICPLPRFVLCSVSSPLEATFTNGENDHG